MKLSQTNNYRKCQQNTKSEILPYKHDQIAKKWANAFVPKITMLFQYPLAGTVKKVSVFNLLALTADFNWTDVAMPIPLIIALWNRVDPLYAFIITLKS